MDVVQTSTTIVGQPQIQLNTIGARAQSVDVMQTTIVGQPQVQLNTSGARAHSVDVMQTVASTVSNLIMVDEVIESRKPIIDSGSEMVTIPVITSTATITAISVKPKQKRTGANFPSYSSNFNRHYELYSLVTLVHALYSSTQSSSSTLPSDRIYLDRAPMPEDGFISPPLSLFISRTVLLHMNGSTENKKKEKCTEVYSCSSASLTNNTQINPDIGDVVHPQPSSKITGPISAISGGAPIPILASSGGAPIPILTNSGGAPIPILTSSGGAPIPIFQIWSGNYAAALDQATSNHAWSADLVLLSLALSQPTLMGRDTVDMEAPPLQLALKSMSY